MFILEVRSSLGETIINYRNNHEGSFKYLTNVVMSNDSNIITNEHIHVGSGARPNAIYNIFIPIYNLCIIINT